MRDHKANFWGAEVLQNCFDVGVGIGRFAELLLESGFEVLLACGQVHRTKMSRDNRRCEAIA